MSAIQTIRKRLGMTQSELAGHLGVSQGSVSFYERGQTVPPSIAEKLIKVAQCSGLGLSFDHIYGGAELPSTADKVA